jgi:hypothetical protein
VSKVLSHVSVDVPDPEASQAPAGGDADAVGPDATGAAHRGLCTAWAARGRNDADRGRSGDSTAFSNLRRAAHHDGLLVEDFCADVLDGGTTADDPSVAPASDPGTEPGGSGAGHGQSDADHGAAGDPPAPVDVPNGGGVGTGTDASQGANDGGASHAADAATRGSANRDGHRNAPSTTTTPTGSAHSGR